MPDRDLSHLYPPFANKVSAALVDLNLFVAKNYPGHEVKIIEGYRSEERQKELYAQGRTKPGRIVTYKNGTTNESNHQSSMSVDLGVFKGGKYLENPPSAILSYWGHCARKQGLEWGGDWKSFKDTPHVEWPTSDKISYFKARVWQFINKLRRKDPR